MAEARPSKSPPPSSKPTPPTVLREPVEQRFSRELAILAQLDASPRPPGWKLSPRAARTFIIGSDGRPLVEDAPESVIQRKFFGNDALVERSIVTLMSDRGLMLVGEPGTAKSMLSELLAAAISGDSTKTIQGAAGVTEDQIKYGWNYALLLAEGPSPRSLVPAPLHKGLKEGAVVRFEELTRCPAEAQDLLISVMSEKLLMIPELDGEQGMLLARPGFNVIGTANLRDRGVHEMSSALKRRFNFETVTPLDDKKFEVELVLREARRMLDHHRASAILEPDVVELLVTIFRNLRQGKTEEGAVVDRPSTAMSTAEAVAVAFAASLDASYLGEGIVRPHHLVRQLGGAVVKDNAEDVKKINAYFNTIVKANAKRNAGWKALFDARGQLDR